MAILLFGSIFCILYYLVIIIYSGIKSTFSSFWLFSGLFFIIAWRLGKQDIAEQFKVSFVAALVIISVFFIYIEAVIIRASLKKAANGAEVVIILGAQVNGYMASRSLLRRVKAGAGYLKENPCAKVIVSGGKGPGEFITEAACMKKILESEGIECSRILLEEHSHNTKANIINSLSLCNKKQKIVIVTCSYHIFRALALAEKQGADAVMGYPVKSSRILCLNYYVREFFAVVKYKLSGEI